MIGPVPWLDPALLRRLGWALVWAYGVLLLVSLLPFTPLLLAWGERLSGVVVDTATLPLVGLLLLRAAGPRPPEPAAAWGDADDSPGDPREGGDARAAEPPGEPAPAGTSEPSPWQDQPLSIAQGTEGVSAPMATRNNAEPALDDTIAPPPAVGLSATSVQRGLPDGLALARIGAIAFLLLALWQLPLWFSGLDRLDGEANRSERELRARIALSQEQLLQADAEQIRLNWQQLQASQPLGLRQQESDTSRQRLLLQQRLRSNASAALKQGLTRNQEARFNLGRERLRVLLLALIYGWALRGLSRWPLA